MNANSLCVGFDPYSNHTPCEVVKCKYLEKISNALKAHHQNIDYKINHANDDAKVENIFDLDQYTNACLLNDFNHLLFHHSNDFEEIHHILINQSNDDKPCQLTTCLSITRNQRNRSIENAQLYSNYKDQKDIIFQQSLDRVHCYYLHSFDCGYKITKRERTNMSSSLDTKENDDDEMKDNTSFDTNVQQMQIQTRQMLPMNTVMGCDIFIGNFMKIKTKKRKTTLIGCQGQKPDHHPMLILIT
eukprot:500192_1